MREHRERLAAARGVMRATRREWPLYLRLLDWLVPGLAALLLLLGP